jgi:hypothetical protein
VRIAAPRVAVAVAAAAAIPLGLLLASTQARAHTRSVSYSSWELDPSGARVTLRLTQLELTRLPWGVALGPELDPDFAAYLTDRLRLLSAGEPCAVREPPRPLATSPDRAAIEWRVACAAAGPREIRSDFMLEAAPGHLHFARVRSGGGAPLERLLTGSERSWPLERPGSASEHEPVGSSLGAYFLLGVEHIWTGYDHLAFVLALLLLATRIGEVATVVTGFTVAHSITLGLAVLGLVEPDARSIEALIGLSIAMVAAEDGWLMSGRSPAVPIAVAIGLGVTIALAALGYGGMSVLTLGGITLFAVCYFGLLERSSRPARLRVAIAFAFGLVHGFGFAGVLAEMELPTQRLAPALLGFNLGVEAGQLVVVAALWPLLRGLARLGGERAHRLVIETTSAAVCGLGLFWFVTRAFE